VGVEVEAALPGMVAILDVHVPHVAQQAPHVFLAQAQRTAEVHEQNVKSHPVQQQQCLFLSYLYTVFRILIHRIHMFLGLPVPDTLVRGIDPDPDPSIIKQNSKENLDFYRTVL
jgi:hypothetical protein